MSYDVWLDIDTGGPERVEVKGTDHNMTSNVAPMWRKAGADLAEFDGKTAGDMLPVLTAAIRTMVDNPSDYEPLNPPNGWGSYGTCLRFLNELRADFERHPKATIRISR